MTKAMKVPFKLLKEDGQDEVIGLGVDVKWKEGTSPAKVLNLYASEKEYKHLV